MVYVFFVQPGDMMTFDNEISIMQSVEDLKDKITEKIRIPKEQQVLLISGGESLDSKKNLCSYMAGTDTNPIYLFSTNYDISKLEILRSLNYNDLDIRQKLLESMKLPVSLNTVKIRTQVASEYFEIAKIQLDFCENMVHEQHLQQQGWSAVIANLDDIICEFKKRWELFLKVYDEFMTERKTYDDILAHFQDDKEILQRVPVIDILLETQREPMDISKLSEMTNASQENEATKEISLYEWISSSDSKNSLEKLHEECMSKLKKFETDIMPSLQNHVTETLLSAEKPERKEIEGLGKRLFDLEELLRKIKKYVEHQSDMAQAFQQNQTSASQTKDMSILPDLCATHLRQLEFIKQYHQKLMDDRNRVIKAKYELSKSLCARIGWVQNIENKLWELDSHLVYFHECLQRLRKHIEVFQQVHLAPTTYVNSVVEVVRRRAFSQLFLLWASDLACQQLTIHNEELTRRKEFNAQFEGHFLNALFPGMGDIPPSFATEAPAMFDAKLPGITRDDVEKLKKELPDFAECLVLPDMEHVTNFFLGRNESAIKENEKDKVDDAKAVEEKLIQAVSEVGLASNLDKNLLKATGSEPCLVTAPGLPNIKDDKGCESETDTDEFEKVGQSPLELTFPQGAPQTVDSVLKPTEKQDASTSTEDNLQISRSEYEKVKVILTNLGSLAQQDMNHLRGDLTTLKTQFLDQTEEFARLYGDLGCSWNNLVVEIDRNEKQIAEVMLREQEAERDNFRYNLLEKDEMITRLQRDKQVMEERNEEITREVRFLEEKIAKLILDNAKVVEDLRKEVCEKEAEKEKAVKEVTENLRHEHKTEIDNIKSRFKLMTMEKSPSLTSLEKEKSGDFVSLPSHTTLFVQMQENFEMDKEKAVLEERKQNEIILEDKIKELKEEFRNEIEVVSQDVAKRVSEDKDKQIDILRERDKNLNLEITKYKMTIQQLAECEREPLDPQVLEAIEVLKNENQELKDELQKIKTERETIMTTSVAVCEEKLDASTSPLQTTAPYDLSRSEIAIPQRPHRLNIDTCKSGDIVLVLWDTQHENFKILQESKHTYFLHSESLDRLGLSIVDKHPNITHCTGEVINKEYCHARKSQNRYKVPSGTRFFRVKVKPIDPLHRDLSSSQSGHHFYTTGMSASQSTVSTFEPVIEESQATTSLEWKQDEPDKEKSGGNRSTARHSDSESGRIDILEQPEEVKPQSVEKNFAEDSGIVESVEQATAATEDSDKHQEDDRSVACNAVVTQKTNSSTNWLEAMFRSMFSKSSE